jgi:hypothetical protein
MTEEELTSVDNVLTVDELIGAELIVELIGVELIVELIGAELIGDELIVEVPDELIDELTAELSGELIDELTGGDGSFITTGPDLVDGTDGTDVIDVRDGRFITTGPDRIFFPSTPVNIGSTEVAIGSLDILSSCFFFFFLLVQCVNYQQKKQNI